MKRFSWLLTAPLTLAILVFAVTNRQDVMLEIWPFGIQLAYPLYLVMLISVGVGILLGAVIAWLSGGRTRQRLRQAKWRIVELERDITWERQQHAKELQELGQSPADGTAAKGTALSTR